MSHYGLFRQRSYEADFGQTFAIFLFTFKYITIALANHNQYKNLAFFANFSETVEFSKVAHFAKH